MSFCLDSWCMFNARLFRTWDSSPASDPMCSTYAINGPSRVRSFVSCNSVVFTCFVEKTVFGSGVFVGATSQHSAGSLG